MITFYKIPITRHVYCLSQVFPWSAITTRGGHVETCFWNIFYLQRTYLNYFGFLQKIISALIPSRFLLRVKCPPFGLGIVTYALNTTRPTIKGMLSALGPRGE